MKSDVFVARLARGAAATAVASAWMLPESQTAANVDPVPAQEAVCIDFAGPPDAATRSVSGDAIVLTVTRSPAEWDKRMEREFRALALEEARGSISSAQAKRLEELNRWRNQLLHPPSSGETLLQLKRDRLLVRMEDVLREYVEFQEAADHKRASA